MDNWMQKGSPGGIILRTGQDIKASNVSFTLSEKYSDLTSMGKINEVRKGEWVNLLNINNCH
jgi:hypothetical protein